MAQIPQGFRRRSAPAAISTGVAANCVGAANDNRGMPDQPKRSPYRGQIQSVSSRSTKGSRRSGLPKVHEIELERADGQPLVARSHAVPTGENLRTATGLCVIGPGQFPFCPICLREDVAADTVEHIPPKAFGGVGMTNTCADCNNRLGSRTESALQDWYDGAVQAHFTSDTSPVPFARDRILMLKTDAGEPVMLLEKSAAEDKSPLDRLKDPNVQMHYRVPPPAEYMTGLLKSVYLAACLHFGGVAHTTSVMAARDELLAARDAKSHRQVKLGSIAEGLVVHRTGKPAGGPPLALLTSEYEGETTYLVSLAGTVLVEWPFPDLDPLLSPRLREG